MKKQMMGIAVMILYLTAISVLLNFQIRLLFEWKSFLLVLLGTILLSFTGIRRHMEQAQILNIMAFSAILSSFIVTLVSLFNGVSAMEDGDYRGMIAMGCRPLLYGVVLYSILHMPGSGHGEKRSELSEQNVAPNKDTVEAPENSETTSMRRDIDYRELGLTRREIEIVYLIQRGLTNREIADELYIAETTVKKHVSHIFEKMDIKKREEL